MNIFVSYAFNDDNRWIEELAIPLIKSIGFDVVTGRRLEGDIIPEGVEARIDQCRGCVGFTTRRAKLGNGKYSTHQWVLDELATARARHLTVVEVRDDAVQVEGASNFFAQIRFSSDKRDKLLVDLADVLARWPVRRIRVQLVPPANCEEEFTTRVLSGGGDIECKYIAKSGNRTVGEGSAVIEPITGGFFIDIEVPNEDVLVQLEIKKERNGSWKSFGSSVKAVPIRLFNA